MLYIIGRLNWFRVLLLIYVIVEVGILILLILVCLYDEIRFYMILFNINWIIILIDGIFLESMWFLFFGLVR